MRFSVDRNDLVRACSHLSSIAAMRTTIPILKNIKLEASGDRLIVTANNLDQSISVAMPAAVEVGGANTVEYQRLQSIASIAPDGADIQLADDRDDGRMEIKSGKSRYKLLTLPAADFPIFEMPDQTTSIILYGTEFERLLSVGYAAADEVQRPYLNGIYLHRSTDGLAAVATDGHRLSLAEIPMPEGAEDVDEFSIILPNATVKILRSLASDDHPVLETDGKKVIVTFERKDATIRFVSKLIEGTYPDYARVIPDRSEGQRFVIEAEPLTVAVKRAMIVHSGKSSSVRLGLSEGKLTLSARSDEGAEAADVVECDWAKEDLEFHLNGRYLLAAINGLNSKEVEITVRDALYPVRFEMPGDQARTDVIMTMRG